MNFCGYDRPNTPNMNELRSKGAIWSCDAYSPAPWTLPSHASFFTGLTVAEHGAQLVPESDIRISQHLQVRPLSDEYETLAEHFSGQGYQTVLLSANPVIRKNSGLFQGFDKTIVASGAGGGDLGADEEHLWRRVLRGSNLTPDLERLLKTLDKELPLFLFVNIFDAHVPYPEVPIGIPWLPPAPSIRFAPTDDDPDNPFMQYTTGAMDAADIPPFLSQLTDLYDYGVFQADKNIGRVLKMLTARGWLNEGFRMVVTSDHGELLGEHGALRHGRFLYEPVVKVPFLFYDSKGRYPTELPTPLSATNAYWLLRDGRLPQDPVIAQAVAERNPNFVQPGHDSAAVWGGDEKLVWTKGEGTSMFHLRLDPGEERPGPVADDHPLLPELEAMVEEVTALEARPYETVDMMEALKAVGYIE